MEKGEGERDRGEGGGSDDARQGESVRRRVG